MCRCRSSTLFRQGRNGNASCTRTLFRWDKEERERILYKNFVQVGQDVKEMIKDVLNKRGAK